MNKKITVALAGVIIIITAITLSVLFRSGGKKEVSQENRELRTDYSQVEENKPDNPQANCVSDLQPRFTASFTDLSKIESLGILGSVVGGSPGRSYVTIKKGEKVPVYNPADAVLETIVWADRGGGQAEFGFYFQASCEVTYLLDHIEEIADGLKSLAPKEPARSTATQFGSQPKVFVKAGKLLGYTDGTPQARTFDFLLMNKAKPTLYVNPARWKWEQAVYGDCPYDYYEENLKKQHYALLGTSVGDGKVLKAENCGSPSQDVAGTAAGGWFQGDGTTEKGKRVLIGRQFNWLELSIRESGSNKVFSLKEFDPKITPEKITSGHSACFQGYENNWAYVKIISDSQLSLATGTGQCPAVFPESQAEMWER